jgi:hypothetical protein
MKVTTGDLRRHLRRPHSEYQFDRDKYLLDTRNHSAQRCEMAKEPVWNPDAIRHFKRFYTRHIGDME